MFFQASRPPAAETATTPVSSDAREVASFAAFMSLPSVADIRAQIARLEESGDLYTPQLAELSEQLGKVLQARGEHRAALAAFERSFQISRRIEGLASPAQAAILAAEIDSQLALGDMEAADLLQQTLFGMQRQLHAGESYALADAERATADWNLRYYLNARQNAAPGSVTEGQQQALAERLARALRHYHEALWLLSQHEGAHDEKVVLERKIAALSLMVDRQHQRAMPALAKQSQQSPYQRARSHNPVLAEHGRAALQRAVAHSAAGADPLQVAVRQLELGDWHLLMDQYDEAGSAYAAAAASLRAAGLAEEQVTAMLGAGLPVADPEAELHALVGEAPAGAFDGYIDVSFDLDRYGKARNARVLASAAHDATYDAMLEQQLFQQVHAARFRPEFVEGTPVATSAHTLRYYYTR